MGIRAKVRRSTPRRATVAVATRASRPAARPARNARIERVAKHGHTNGKSHVRPSHNHAHARVEHKPSTGITGFAKALRFLGTLSDFEKLRIVRYNSQNFDLDRMRTLLKKLGNPQDHFRSVHIAGTKGKGSTAAMVAAMLQACGYKVGVYTSPHLVDIRERIQINGEMISHADFGRLVKSIEPLVAHSRPVPTYFDVLTAIAFK